mgnify:CR=1 FL=1
MYGLRVAPSKFGYRSLGAGTEVVTEARHCRAEAFWRASGGCRSIQPTCARWCSRAAGNLALTDQKVVDARRALFGSWEMNWLAYNVAHDIDLPGCQGRDWSS